MKPRRERHPSDRRRPKKNAARTSQLVRAAQAATETGLPYTTLRRLAFQGELPVVKVGTAWYFKRLDIEAYIARQLRQLAS
jgi:excisionase family DNA binding protein